MSLLRILNVEDNQNDSELIQAELATEWTELEIVRVETRKAFTTAVAQGRFDLIICDYSLPDFDGISALAIAKENSPDIPFIFVSGTIGEDLAIEALKKGASDYVLKNNLSRLVSVVRRALNEAEERRNLKQAEDAMLIAAERLRIGLNSANIAVFNQDRDLRYTWMYQPQLGYTSDQVVGKTDADLLPARDAPGIMAIKRRVIETGIAEHIEVPIHLDNQEIYFDMNIAPFRDIEGAIIGITGSSYDTTERKRAEGEIKFKNTILQTQQETSLDAILVVDENQKIISYSQQFIDMWGLPAQMVSSGLDSPVLQMVADQVENPEDFVARVHYLYAHRDEKSHKEVLLKDGRVIDRYSAPITAADGKYYGRVWYFRDITERKTSELALRKSESQLSEALRIARIGYWEYQFATDEFVFNDQYYSLHKITVAKAGGYRMSSADFARRYVYPEDAPMIGRQVQLAFESVDPDYSAMVETRILSGEGEIVWVEVRMRIEKDAQGRTIRLIGVNQDITERKRAEELLRESEQQLRAIFEGARDGILVAEVETGSFLSGNPAICSMLGYTLEELLCIGLSDIHQKQDLPHAQKDFQKLSQGEIALSTDIRVMRKDGSIFYADISAGQLRVDNRDCLIGVFRDITERKRSEASLRKLSLAVEQSPSSIVITDLGANIEYANAAFYKITGYSQTEVIGQNPRILHSGKTPKASYADMWAHLTNGQDWKGEFINKRKDGSEYTESALLSPVRQADGKATHYLAIMEDITERKAAEVRIKYLNRVHAVLSGINTLIVRVNDRDQLFREACRIAVETGGFRMSMLVIVDRKTMKLDPVASAGKDEELLTLIKNRLASIEDASTTMVGMAIMEKQPIVSNDSLNDSRVVFGKHYADAGIRSFVVMPLMIAGESVGTISLYASEIEFFHDEEMMLLTELAGDIAFAIDHIDKQERINYLAYYDALTGLANRSLFLERLETYMRSAVSGGYKLAIGLIDLERFKNINDSLGRPAGDALLKQVAEWMAQKIGDANLLARIDADHFAIVLPEVRSDGNLSGLVESLLAAFIGHPFHLNDVVLRIGIKVGVAVFPDDGGDSDTLFKHVEAALKMTKKSGDRYLFHTKKMTEAVANKLSLENQLRQAIDNEEFVLHYQPKVNIASGKITSAEALIRWNDPRTGLVPPGKFIPILEETGLIYEVGRWALRQAIADNLRWRSAGLPAMRIAVNVSALQLHNPGFIAEIEQAIGNDAHTGEGLELEITESMIMGDIVRNIASLQAIRSMGITIAIDDFGTGFSSLSYLAKLPIDTLKIDRSFVIEMTVGPGGLALVSTIIKLAHALKLKVVAEGVETEEQLRLLGLLECDEMQGYLFSKAVPAEIFETRFLAQPNAG